MSFTETPWSIAECSLLWEVDSEDFKFVCDRVAEKIKQRLDTYFL